MTRPAPPTSSSSASSSKSSSTSGGDKSNGSSKHQKPPLSEKQRIHAQSMRQANSMIWERDGQIQALQSELNGLTNKLASLNANTAFSSKYIKRRQKKTFKLPAYEHVIQSDANASNPRNLKNRPSVQNRPNLIMNRRAHMARNASIATAKVFNNLPDDHDDSLSYIANPKLREEIRDIIDRIQSMFKDPSSRENMAYLRSAQFAGDILRINRQACHLLEEEPRCAFLQSPCYVFGDIHGNLEDLHFFSDNIWRLGMSLTAGNFVFLGDYVDRGMSCMEVVAYLLSMKLLLPHKVTLLRGNHETRDVNGWEEHYGVRSFIHQCQERFGDDVGYRVWESTNQVFDRLPLSAVIDQDIFCVHGGIPRPVTAENVSRVQDILGVPRVAGINPPYEHESEASQQVASDCIWSDPASDEQEMHGVNPDTGFGESLRGGGAICFGHKAVTDFLQQQGFSYIMRAHEAHAEGVAVSKGARVFTVFSTSKDHNQGTNAMAGCILVDSEKMQVINRSPAYKNQYVHRRDSVSLLMLSEGEIDQRIELGLVTMDPDAQGASGSHSSDGEDNEYNVEEWDDFEDAEAMEGTKEDDGEEDPEEMHYVLDTRRHSAVDPASTTASPMGSSHDNHDWGSSGGGGSDNGGGAGVGRKHFTFPALQRQSSSSKQLEVMSPLNESAEDAIEEDEDSTVDGSGGGADRMEEDDVDGGGKGSINYSSKNVSSRHKKGSKSRR